VFKRKHTKSFLKEFLAKHASFNGRKLTRRDVATDQNVEFSTGQCSTM